jgi:hypothetical protein
MYLIANILMLNLHVYIKIIIYLEDVHFNNKHNV